MLNVIVFSLTLAGATWQSPPAALPDMYQSVHALVWVVRDLDRTVAGWRKLGFADIRVVGDVTFDGQYRDKPSTCTVKVAEGHLGDVAVQWIQPMRGTSAYSDFLARHGTGVFSLVHRARSRDALQAEIERLSRLGVGVLQTESAGASSGPSIRTYFDTERSG
jgi:hypothetical protein